MQSEAVWNFIFRERKLCRLQELRSCRTISLYTTKWNNAAYKFHHVCFVCKCRISQFTEPRQTNTAAVLCVAHQNSRSHGCQFILTFLFQCRPITSVVDTAYTISIQTGDFHVGFWLTLNHTVPFPDLW
jgi:hypothetical protein